MSASTRRHGSPRERSRSTSSAIRPTGSRRPRGGSPRTGSASRSWLSSSVVNTSRGRPAVSPDASAEATSARTSFNRRPEELRLELQQGLVAVGLDRLFVANRMDHRRRSGETSHLVVQGVEAARRRRGCRLRRCPRRATSSLVGRRRSDRPVLRRGLGRAPPRQSVESRRAPRRGTCRGGTVGSRVAGDRCGPFRGG